MPNSANQLQKIASALPIVGAPFAPNNKTKRFVTDTAKFIFGILMMSLVRLIQDNQNQADMSSPMDMSDTTMNDASNNAMNMLSISMFLIMYAQMRSGAMIGELAANQVTRCCTQPDNDERTAWRKHEIPQNWLSTLPLVGSFFKTSHKKHMLHLATMDIAMYSLGTIAMMLSFHEFDDTALEEPAAIFRMYLGMALGMVSVMVAFMFIDKILATFCAESEAEINHDTYQLLV